MRLRALTSRALLALAVAALAGCGGGKPAPAPAPQPAARNLVLVSLDTVRRDHLSIYGYQRPTSPALAGLAGRSLVFDRAFTHATNTSPSHATLFTGLLPDRHGVWTNGSSFAGDAPTLASLLGTAGFATAGFVSGLTMQAVVNLNVGFQHYDDRFSEPRRDGAVAVDGALRWLRGPDARRRYFLFVHLFDAHGPYYPPPAFAGRFHSPLPGRHIGPYGDYQLLMAAPGIVATHANFYIDRYDETIAYEDSLVARLLDGVDLRSTIVVVLADHGETLDERYWMLDHGGSLVDEQMRVPLVVHVPGWPPRRVPAMVGLVDVMPTLLSLLGVRVDQKLQLQGHDLVPYLRGEAEAPPTEIVAAAQVHPERLAPLGYDLDDRRSILGLRTGRWKLVLYPGKSRDYVQLYDLAADPGEHRDLAAQRPGRRDRLLRELRASIDTRRPREADEDDPELAAKLRAIGYAGH